MAVPFKLDINLQRYSMNVLAVQFWGLPMIKKKIREFSEKELEDSYLKDFNKITEEVLLQLNNIHLPENVLVEIRETISCIGEKIYQWINYVRSDLRLLDRGCIENICWTSYGTIDEAKVFQLHWQNDLPCQMDPKMFEDDLHEMDHFSHCVFTIACILGQERFVSSNLTRMRKTLKDLCEPWLHIQSSTNEHSLIRIWVCCFFGSSIKHGCGIYKMVRENIYSDGMLLTMCATAPHLNAVKYFADNLKKGENYYFWEVAEKTLKNYEQLNDNKNKYASLEIILFLINKMSDERKNEFLRVKVSGLFKMLMDAWPYQELFLKIFDYTLPFMTNEDQEMLLGTVTNYFCSRSQNRKGRVVSHQVLQKLLEVTSQEIKFKKIVRPTDLSYNLIRSGDYATLKLILSDPEIAMHMKETISIEAQSYFKTSVDKGDFQPIDNFMKVIFEDDNERKSFKNNFNLYLKKFVEEDKMELSYKLLDWLADTPEEKTELKRGINSVEVCRKFYDEGKFSIPKWTKLLNWQYDGDEEEIKRVIAVLRTDEMVRNEFCKIWCGNFILSAETSKADCTKLLNFFFRPEEIELFKEEKLIHNEDFIKVFCDYLSLPQDFEITVDEIFKFCGVASEEIKRKIRDDIAEWITLLGINKSDFRTAYALVNWVVENEEDKKRIIGEYLNSVRGIELLLETEKVCSKYFLDPILMLLNLWVKPYGSDLQLSGRPVFPTSEDNDIQVKLNNCIAAPNISWLLFKLKKNGHLSKDNVKVMFQN